MDIDFWGKAKELNRRIGDTSDISTWEREQHGPGEVPAWQRSVISHLMALSGNEEIRFLDAHVVYEEPTATFIAFTDARVIRINVDFTGDSFNRRHEIASETFSRSLVKTIRLTSIANVTVDTREFPTGLKFDVVLDSGEVISLPLNRYPRQAVAAELTALLDSLLSGDR